MQKKLMIITGLVATSLVFSASAIAASNTNNGNQQKNIKIHQNKNLPIAMGNILAINGSTFTITTRERGSGTEVTKTITVSSDTKYTKDRDTVITLSDLATGQKVMIEGTKDSSGNITATSVNVVTKAPEFREPHKERGSMGAIASINGSTFTITTRERDSGEITKTITVSSDTKYTKDRDNVITLSDLTVGQKVMIEGTKDSSGNITATSVNVVTKAPANPEQE